MNIHRILKRAQARERWSDWFDYAFAFASAAQCLARQVESLEQKDDLIVPDETLDERHWLLVPLLFNFRHAIELLLKFLAVLNSLPPERTHDTARLFAAIRVKLGQLDEKHAEQESVFKAREYIRAHLEQMEEMIRKYRMWVILDSGEAEIDDEKNELFRYPASLEPSNGPDLEFVSRTVAARDILPDIDFLRMFLTMALVGYVCDSESA